MVNNEYILTFIESKIALFNIKTLSEACSIKEEETFPPTKCNYILKLKDDRYALGYRHGDIKILSINLDSKEMKIDQSMKIDNEYISTIIELKMIIYYVVVYIEKLAFLIKMKMGNIIN